MKEAISAATYWGALVAAPLIFISVFYFYGKPPENHEVTLVASDHAQDHSSLTPGKNGGDKLWICPMHAQILQDHPGSCPICGMDLVESNEHHHSDAGIQVDTAMQQRMGVKLARLTTKMLSKQIHTYGTVAINEKSLFNISPKIDGWIRKLSIAEVGQYISAGQVLYEIYSPELVQRQREYIELLQRRDQLLENITELSGQNAQVAASYARERIRSREKFLNADINEGLIKVIETTRHPLDAVPVLAPKSGFVTQINVREGSYVTPMVNLLSLANLSTVWINIELYPGQMEWISDGNEVSVTLPHRRHTTIKGRLTLPNPTVNGTTRTLQGRLLVNNPTLQLRPGSFVNVTIAARPQKAFVVPRSAVMRTGKGNTVMLSRGDGHFMPVEIKTGIEDSDFIEITDGLAEGAEVAVNGQFLLDSAASISDTIQRMRTSE